MPKQKSISELGVKISQKYNKTRKRNYKFKHIKIDSLEATQNIKI